MGSSFAIEVILKYGTLLVRIHSTSDYVNIEERDYRSKKGRIWALHQENLNEKFQFQTFPLRLEFSKIEIGHHQEK